MSGDKPLSDEELAKQLAAQWATEENKVPLSKRSRATPIQIRPLRPALLPPGWMPT
jgi:hypothetical protein